MDENKYKESIEECIGDEQLFNRQLKDRILNEIRGTKQRKGVLTLFKKLTPVAIALMLFLGVGTFLYFNLSTPSKQEVSSPNDDGLFELIDDNEEADTQGASPIPNHEEVPSEITFDTGRGKIINVPISAIPELDNYLAEAMDIKTELERIQIEYVDWNMFNSDYFVLNYGCGNKLCDLVLIEINDLQEVKTVYLANGMVIDSKTFEQKAMVRIAVNEGNMVVRHQIIVVDLTTMVKLAAVNKNDEETYFNAPLYPISDFKWIAANTIELVVADLPDTNYESIEKWSQATNPPVKRVEIMIE